MLCPRQTFLPSTMVVRLGRSYSETTSEYKLINVVRSEPKKAPFFKDKIVRAGRSAN